jgi:cytochrome c553
MKRSLALAGAALLAVGAASYGFASSPRQMAEVEAVTSRCAFCHGTAGIAQNPIWPSIAGMDAVYLEQQLDAFAAGSEGPRRSAHAAQMYAISKWLDEEQRTALARHYAKLPAPSWLPADEASVGGQLFSKGDGAVIACATCHGADGSGDPDLNAPRLGGQSARYISAQLAAYAAGSRLDAGSGMAAIAAAMTDEQISAIAAYLEQTKRAEP